MRLLALFPLPFLMAICAPASAGNVDYARSEITFISKQMNVPVQGRFMKFRAQIAFDPGRLASSKAAIEVDLASVDAGSTEANDELRRKSWFNTSAFPSARFVSGEITQTGPDRYEAGGKLSIKGIGQDVAVPFSVKRAGDAVTYEGSFTLRRLQFRIGEGDWSETETVADEVQVKFHILTTGNK